MREWSESTAVCGVREKKAKGFMMIVRGLIGGWWGAKEFLVRKRVCVCVCGACECGACECGACVCALVLWCCFVCYEHDV